MSAMRRTIERLRTDEAGVTLVELMVATMILGVVMLIFTGTLATVQRAVVRQDELSRTNDQARLALQQIDRQLRSGNVLYNPALEEDDPYYSARIYTQTNSAYVCVQWKIDLENRLLTRHWPPENPAAVTGWRVAAEGIVNREQNVHAFELDPDPLKGSRVLKVSFLVNVDEDGTAAQATDLQASFTGRNTSYGFPVSVCSPVPEE
jgi:prepilin-type N-terminal cleavage/methylation domain-containing protein